MKNYLFILLFFAVSLSVFAQSQKSTPNFELDFSEVVDISEPPVFIPDEVVEKFAEENNLDKDQVKFKVIRRTEVVKTDAVIRNETFINQILPLTVHSSVKEDED